MVADRTEYKRAWRKANREKEREYARRYKEKYPDRVRALSLARTESWRARNPVVYKKYQQNWSLQKKFGISLKERNALLRQQGSKCAGCNSRKPNWKGDWHVDHCHITKKIRGILCHNCNTALGRVKDSPEVLRNLVRYLESNAELRKIKSLLGNNPHGSTNLRRAAHMRPVYEKRGVLPTNRWARRVWKNDSVSIRAIS